MRRVLDELQVPEAYREAEPKTRYCPPPTILAPPGTGRPPIPFNQTIADEILERILTGEPMHAICAEARMPGLHIIYKWRAENECFARDYARARELSAESCEHNIMRIVMEEPDVARAKLQADSWRWLASIRNPKTHGQKTETTLNINVGLADRLEGAIRRTESKVIDVPEVREIPSGD